MSSRLAPSISIVIPAFNEERTIEQTTTRCLSALARWVDDYEIVILDDGSRDATVATVAAIGARHPDLVRTLAHRSNRGIAATFERLYREARKQFVLMIPADGQYPPEALGAIVPLLGTCDVVVLNRTRKTYSAIRMFVSRCYRWLPRLLFGVDLIDPGSAKCIRRDLIADIPVRSKGVFVEAERIIRAVGRGHRVGAVDIVQTPRAAGVGLGASPAVVIGALRDLVMLWVELVLLRRRP